MLLKNLNLVRGDESSMIFSNLALIAVIRDAASTHGDLSRFVPARTLADTIAAELAPYITASVSGKFHLRRLTADGSEDFTSASFGGVLHCIWQSYDGLDKNPTKSSYDIKHVRLGTGAVTPLVDIGNFKRFLHGFMDNLKGKDSLNAAYFRNKRTEASKL